MLIHVATTADIPALVDLDAIASHDPPRRRAIAEWVARGECHVAAGNDSEPAGYVALTRSFFRSPFIEMLQVKRSERRRGIARALLQHCIAGTPADAKLWTSTDQSNSPMQALLPQLGFIQCGMFEHLDPGDPELIYVRFPDQRARANTSGII